jgi:large subunit ribosomal protein L17
MQHRKNRLRLSGKPQHRRMTERNLVTSLLLYENIRTTKKRAKVIQPIVEQIITLSKTKETRLAIRSIQTMVTHENACRKVMEVLKNRYSKRGSGYTRIVPVGARKGDGASLVDLSLLDGETAPAATPAK